VKILFLDDSFRTDKNYLGHGGFCIDEADVNRLCEDIIKLKRMYKIPDRVEIKWSPGRDHFLRATFKGDRKHLYRDLLGLLNSYDVSIIGSVHNLNDCNGIKIYKWDTNRAILWATKEQFKFIAERFEKPFLETTNDYGIIIADKYSEHKGEIELLKEVSFAIAFGTNYRKFKRICMNPLMAISDFCPAIQISDTIIGIIVGALAKSRYAEEYIKELATFFLKDPHEGSSGFSSTISSSIMGYGLILFPTSFRAKGMEMFKDLDTEYVYTNEGIKEKGAG